ncbi:MAG: UDP-N-acetylmuramate dehydrogenase [Bacteroidetes bacterium]|nr:UDP-N-acetylmuramate dehydrogenase [Bacteroidota bacterium]MCH8523889.1 UDP-N-acetylmuramate dehydrogenase [Balneolales bacterium]
MVPVQHNYNLKDAHTFHMDVHASLFFEVIGERSLDQLRSNKLLREKPWVILGGGSNVLFTENVTDPVVKISIPGISVRECGSNTIMVKVGAGVNWHELVLWSLDHGYSGLENLSLIPGQCGAAPMQNIGAYGVELVQVFESLDAFEISTGLMKTFYRDECAFGYRTSIFKTELKNKFIITSITLRLHRNRSDLNLDYGDIQNVLNDTGIRNPTPRDVSNAVIKIRQSKLPDPNQIGNAGSFFKNPEIDHHLFKELKRTFPEIPGYAVGTAKVKVPAGWLIDKLGLKGYRNGDAGVHDKQALVLVNHGSANGHQILAIAHHIQDRVQNTYGILLEPEVNIYP